LSLQLSQTIGRKQVEIPTGQPGGRSLTTCFG
jgi:hypothetical protein